MVTALPRYFFSLGLLSILGSVAGSSAQELRKDQELRKELYDLDLMRRGPKTPLTQVSERGSELLRKYPDRKDQGLIYYQLAHIYAQSGMVQPERVIDYVKKAMECPLELSRRLRLYVYWGDALQLSGAKEPFAETRKSASKAYLEGLREIGTVPEKAGELPGVFKYDAGGPPEEVAKMQKKHKEALEARERAEMVNELIMHRDVLIGQLVGLYSRPPFATKELEDLARETLKDATVVEKLAGEARLAADKARAKLPKEVLVAAREKLAPEGDSESGTLLLVLGTVGLLLLAILVSAYAYRRFAQGRKA